MRVLQTRIASIAEKLKMRGRDFRKRVRECNSKKLFPYSRYSTEYECHYRELINIVNYFNRHLFQSWLERFETCYRQGNTKDPFPIKLSGSALGSKCFQHIQINASKVEALGGLVWPINRLPAIKLTGRWFIAKNCWVRVLAIEVRRAKQKP